MERVAVTTPVVLPFNVFASVCVMLSDTSISTSPSSITSASVSAVYAATISVFVPVKVATLLALIATVE